MEGAGIKPNIFPYNTAITASEEGQQQQGAASVAAHAAPRLAAQRDRLQHRQRGGDAHSRLPGEGVTRAQLEAGIEAYKDLALELVVAAASLRNQGYHRSADKKEKEAGECHLAALTHQLKLEKWHEQGAAQDEKATPGISDSVVLDDAGLHEQQQSLTEQGQIQPCQQVQAKKVSYVGKALAMNKLFKRAAMREAEKRAEKVLWDSEQDAKKWDERDQETAQGEVNEATQAWDQSVGEYAEKDYKLYYKLQLKTLPLSSIPEIGKESSIPELIADQDESHE